MGMKHTPGPWVTNSFGTQVLTGDSWNTICEIYIGKDHRFASWKDGRAATTQDANARLIAAAPKLLATLKSAAAWLDTAKHTRSCEDGGSYCTCGLTAVILENANAIADAEGRS